MIELNVLSMSQFKSLFILIFSFIIVLFLVPILSKIAYKFNILDNPDGKLKIQKHSIPYLGGLAIFFGFIITAIFFKLIFEINSFFLLGLILITVIGLLDDLIILSPFTKLLGQITVSLIFLNSINSQSDILFNSFILLWFVSIMNAFNLIDVMDGLATTVALFSSIYFLWFQSVNNDLFLIFFSFIGSLFGFLYYNKPSAKIYLGDCGSLFIGAFLAYSPFLVHKNITTFKDINVAIITLIGLAIPILELCGLIIIRLYKKIPIYLGSPDHFSIYMQRKGWSKFKILFLVSILYCTLFLFSVLYTYKIINFYCLLLFILFFLFAWLFFAY